MPQGRSHYFAIKERLEPWKLSFSLV